MGGHRTTESWLSSFWRISRNKSSEGEKQGIGILAFEIVSLMSKVVKLWRFLSDAEVLRLREEVVNSVGIRHLVSEDVEYVIDLALSEIMEDLVYVARSVVRLGKRCTDPSLHSLEAFLNEPIRCELEWAGWKFKWKKMDKKVKKMEKYVGLMLQLSQEQEVLAELEQSLRRMRANSETDQVKLLEFQQKVMCQRQEVKNLRDLSPWSKTYDYIVRLLARSLVTIIERIKLVFGNSQMLSDLKDGTEGKDSTLVSRSQSFSALIHSSIHPMDGSVRSFYSGPLGRSVSKSLVMLDENKTYRLQEACHPSFSAGNYFRLKSKRLPHVGPFKGCKTSGNDSPIVEKHKYPIGGSMRISSVCRKDTDLIDSTQMHALSESNRIYSLLTLFYSRCRCLTAPSSTLGHAGLAFHYAKVIVLIEKLAFAPHLISIDARDDLYDMLPFALRAELRTRLKSYGKMPDSSIYDSALEAQWNMSLAQMLDWLAPLAHNTVRWQSERNIEKQHEFSGSNVLLVQTLFFADKAKTEAAITELLLGLNYLCRISRELHERTFPNPFRKSSLMVI